MSCGNRVEISEFSNNVLRKFRGVFQDKAERLLLMKKNNHLNPTNLGRTSCIMRPHSFSSRARFLFSVCFLVRRARVISVFAFTL